MEPVLIADKSPTLCLNMIVKNESKIITRLFDSIVSIIDCYCICDTGSTDDTVKIITEYFQKKNIPGKVVMEPFKNFCHNRNFAMRACLGMSDYIILLDADMTLEITKFDKAILNTRDSHYILQGNDAFYYQNMRIVKNNGLYKYVGVTHEYIDTPSGNTTACFGKQTLFIRDIGDGGAKHDKFERDIRLLLEGIKEEPTNARYHFYLANSYCDSGHIDEAITYYKKRIELGGWVEEVWYSYYKLGVCFKNMNKIPEAINYWMEGYNFYPARLEGLFEMLHYYRMNSKHVLGHLIYKEVKPILDAKRERSHHLFLHNNVYTHKLYYEYTIIAAYVGIKNINDEVVEVLNNTTDSDEVSCLLRNMKFYKDVLRADSKITLDSTVTSNINNEDVKLYSSSSCLIPNADRDGYKLNVRYVNYYITDSGSYLHCDKYIITVNKYIELDTKFNSKLERWMDVGFDNRRYIGTEDVRIFQDVATNTPLYIGTGYHRNENLGIVVGDYTPQTGKFAGNEIVPDFNNASCEKNWVFFDYNGATHVIYQWHPLKICKINGTTLTSVESKSMPLIFKHTRGSTCGFKYSKPVGESQNGNMAIQIVEDEIWFVTHLVSYETPRHYYHLIAVFDANMNLLRYSAPFKFEGEPIEYCLSIVVEDERVLMNYSTWDRTTRIGVYDKKYIDSIVKYT